MFQRFARKPTTGSETVVKINAGNIRDALFRCLMTPDAPSAEVMALATAYLDSHPPIGQTVLQSASNAAGYHATEHDRDTMIRLARDRENGSGRVWIFEWLVVLTTDVVSPVGMAG